MNILARLSRSPLLRLKQPTKSLSQLKQIHAQLLTNGLNSLPILAQLIERYCAFCTDHAYLVFASSVDPNVYLLNVLIRCSTPRDSILVFANWVSKTGSAFDDFTYIFVLGACARSCTVSALWEGKQIHARVIKHGALSNIMAQTTAIHFYASSKDVGSARQLFDEMAVRSSVTWNAMIRGYCSQKVKVSDHPRSALLLFKNMLVDDDSGVKPTDTTLVCVLSAASQLGVLETGTCVHGYIEKTLYVSEGDVFIGTGLLDMYSKCGCLGSALYVFRRMKEKNILTWTAMTTGLAIHGEGEQAMEILNAMEAEGLKPNMVTFTSLFSACCHAGLVKEGLSLFHSMKSKFGVTPLIQHYGCVVDLLGRAGHLKEAYEFIQDMQAEPDAVLWRSLLNACKVHGDAVMGEVVGQILLQLQPEQGPVELIDMSEDYVALSNVYASAERWEDVEKVRDMMKIKGTQTKPGCSSLQSFPSNLLGG